MAIESSAATWRRPVTAPAVTIARRTASNGAAPASPQQRRYWHEYARRREHGRQAIFHSLLPLRITGPLDATLLERALSLVVERHDALRTRFAIEDDVLVQHTAAPESLQLPIRALPADELADTALRDCIRTFVAEDFDLTRDPMLRARLIATGEGEHALLVIVHHIVYDGWSMGLLLAEIATAYGALRAGLAPDLAVLPIQYADYAGWCVEDRRQRPTPASLAHWQRILEGVPAAPSLPTDRPRPAAQTWAGACLGTTLPASARATLEAAAATANVSVFQAFLGLLALEMWRWTGQDEVLIGCPAANRVVPEVEQLIGLFVNLLPLRLRIDGGQALEELAGDVRDTVLESLEHQDVPFEQIAALAKIAPSPAHHSLVQVVATYSEGAPPTEFVPGETRAELIAYRYDESVHFDLTFILRRDAGELVLDSYYATDLFDAATVERLVSNLLALLDAVAVLGSGAPVGRLLAQVGQAAGA